MPAEPASQHATSSWRTKAASDSAEPSPTRSASRARSVPSRVARNGRAAPVAAGAVTREDALQLWVHEAARVFGDRLVDAGDRDWLARQLDERLSAGFGTSVGALFVETDGKVWCLGV